MSPGFCSRLLILTNGFSSSGIMDGLEMMCRGRGVLLIFSSSFLMESISRRFICLAYLRLETAMLLRSDIEENPFDGSSYFFYED